MTIPIRELIAQTVDARTSLEVIFTEISEGERRFLDIYRRDFIELYDAALKEIVNDLRTLERDPLSAERLRRTVSDKADSIDYINEICRRCESAEFAALLENAISDAFNADGLLGRLRSSHELNPGDRFAVTHAERLCAGYDVIARYVAALREADEGGSAALSRLNPSVDTVMKAGPALNENDSIDYFLRCAEESDPFAGHRAYRYKGGEFQAVDLNYIRPVEGFFGFLGVRQSFEDHYSGFARGEHNVPLLVSSLPGLGKTHFSIAYALSHPKITLILPEPEDLERGLEKLIGKLSVRNDRKFVIFFDDIEPDKIDWYYFRTHVGGSIALAPNICVTVASNYEFPANISSRGLGVQFPMFDELRCMEMIEEFLKTMGLRNPKETLVMSMAADYVEQFGQHKYEELSPRTLMRYLDVYKHDRTKRKFMLDASSGDVVVKPDPQAFYVFYVKLMKAIHGPDIVNVLQEEKLKKDLGVI